MNKQFKQAIAALNQTNEAFAAGLISPVEHGDRREAALAGALVGMASQFGVQLKSTRYIDARGDMSLVAKGAYGARFAALLNTANPRCGIAPGAVLCGLATWCYMNHFDVERLVQRFYQQESAKPSARGLFARRLRAALMPVMASA